MIEEELLDSFDILQVPAWLLYERRELVRAWKHRRKENLVIVNSPVRHVRPCSSHNEIEEQYKALFLDELIDVVLTGTRTHIAETIEYWHGAKESFDD